MARPPVIQKPLLSCHTKFEIRRRQTLLAKDVVAAMDVDHAAPNPPANRVVGRKQKAMVPNKEMVAMERVLQTKKLTDRHTVVRREKPSPLSVS
jgi:hypothetical protein